MKLTGFVVFAGISLASFSQEEVLQPLLMNPYVKHTPLQTKAANNIDSSFIYVMDTLELPVFDDFSTDKFVKYTSGYTDGNVTSEQYHRLMDPSNTVPLNPTLYYCDSAHAHIDSVFIVAGVTTVTKHYFTTPNSVWVNDLSVYPVDGGLTNLYQECYVIIDSVIDGVPNLTQDTIYYTATPTFVQDSAQVFIVDVNDPNQIWIDNSAYHNYRYAVDPWSLGVVTFDGVDETGMPYNFGNALAHEPADVLTSRPINLAGKTSVYLTFIVQPKGHGNAPESNDSLILEWWIPGDNSWQYSGWYFVGGDAANDSWTVIHRPVPSVGLADGFRFRFRNWATTSGNLDHWHIDYVGLRDNQLSTASNFSDLAISEPINSFLKDYTVVPWDHFQNSNTYARMLDTLRLKVFNSDNTPTNYANGELSVRFGGILQGGPFVLLNPAVSGEWTGNWELGMNTYRYPVRDNYVFYHYVTAAPQAAFDVKLNVDAAVGGSNIHDVNDTTYFQQKFDNFYAYDDGSAEAGYGITGTNTKLAYKFTAYEADTLTGILMHFMPTVTDVSTKQFLLTVWADNNGVPGDIIYQDDYFSLNNPEYSGGINGFRYYTFMDNQTVVVPQTFYVGWEQLESVSLNLGMDMNIDNSSKIFVNLTGSWMTTFYPGSLLMRPVFSTRLNSTLSSQPAQSANTEVAIQIYPNPANDFVYISGIQDVVTVSIIDMSGRLVYQGENESEIDISYLNSGIYIVDVRNQNGVSLHTGKLIKQ